MRGRGRGARVSEFFVKESKSKRKYIFFLGGGVGGGGRGGERRGGLELVNFYSKNQNLKIEFFYGAGSERARVSDFVTTYPHVKMFFFSWWGGGGARISDFFFKESKYNNRKKVLFFFSFFGGSTGSDFFTKNPNLIFILGWGRVGGWG